MIGGLSLKSSFKEVSDKEKACKEEVSHHQQCLVGKGSRRQKEGSHLPVENGCSDSG
jgi:hypothetical protein